MALQADYVTLDELKAHLRITDTNDDTALAVVITAASRAVDEFCNQRFGNTGSVVDRVYSWQGEYARGASQVVRVDPISTASGLVVKADTALTYTYDTTLTLGTDFDLGPLNAAGNLVPYDEIVLRYTSSNYIPYGRARLQVTAVFGWASVPSAVEIATLIQAARFFVRRNSPYGVAGSPEAGSEVRLLAKLDPDVQTALAPYRRWWGAAGGC